ncbi:hypothetical protein [Beijerinckia sp. L45]|uniref:hypothetical protein n=1 Tax=Beijerinckia sp. L45 TaxID=1641855 RepID=UPI00131DB91E|nr:hypothetical protein [Beijerinckia sp. L45]
MLTPDQYQRLPHLAREIVVFDRAIRAEKTAPVAHLEGFRQLRSQRAALVEAADRTWGAPIRGDGATRS